MPSPPKKTEFKIGESSAFLSYTKFCDRQGEQQVEKRSKRSESIEGLDKKSLMPQTHGRSERSAERLTPRLLPQGSDAHDQSPMVQNHSHATTPVGIPGGELSMEHPTTPWEAGNNSAAARSSNLNVYMGPNSHGAPINGATGWSEQQLRHPRYPQPRVEQLPMFQMHIQNESLMGVPTIPPFASSHHLPPNMLAAANMHPQALMSPPMYFGLDGPMGLNPRIPPMHSLPPGHPGHGMALPSGFSYYPIQLPVGQPTQMWSAMPSMPISEHKLEKSERREAALSKFRQKRKDRCFEKKIRYVSRKRLAEQRPRNRGQFVRRNNGSEIPDNETDDEDEEDDPEVMSVGTGDTYPVDRVALCVRL